MNEPFPRWMHRKRVGHPRYEGLARASVRAYSRVYESRLPGIVADIGCSSGCLLAGIEDLLKGDVVLKGLDYGVWLRDRVYTGEYADRNLGIDNTSDLDWNADLVICQEVLEHIHPDRTEKALQTFYDVSKRGAVLVFGAAHVGQPGFGHINCADKMYWRCCLEQNGWDYSEEASRTYTDCLKEYSVDGCWLENTMCFVSGA